MLNIQHLAQHHLSCLLKTISHAISKKVFIVLIICCISISSSLSVSFTYNFFLDLCDKFCCVHSFIDALDIE